MALVGGKNGSNQKMSENKKFFIISVNLNPKFQVPNPKIAFYQNTLLLERNPFWVQKIINLSSPIYVRSEDLMKGFELVLVIGNSDVL